MEASGLGRLQFLNASDMKDGATDESANDAIGINIESDFNKVMANHHHIVIRNFKPDAIAGMDGKRPEVFRLHQLFYVLRFEHGANFILSSLIFNVSLACPRLACFAPCSGSHRPPNGTEPRFSAGKELTAGAVCVI